jgi:hypothetical protein
MKTHANEALEPSERIARAIKEEVMAAVRPMMRFISI